MGGAVVLGLVGVAGVFTAIAAAAPAKKGPPPPPTTIVTTTIVTTTNITTTIAPTPAPQPSPPPPSPAADMSVQALGGDAGGIFAGDSVTYTDIVTNNGPNATSGVQLADEPVGGARVVSALSSSGKCTSGDSVSCTLGSLGVGSSAVVTVTVMAGSGPTVGHAVRTTSDLPDPEGGNNEVRLQASILAGHAGAPGVSPAGATGAFRPPLVASASGALARVLNTTITLDEAATITVSVVDAAGARQTLLPGSRIDYVPAQRPHLELPWVVDRARRVPLKLRIATPPGRAFQLMIRAVGPTGVASTTAIGFRS